MRSLLFIFILFSTSVFPQELPIKAAGYMMVTSYESLNEYVRSLDHTSELLKVMEIGKSVEGRNLYSLSFSREGIGKDESKIKVLFFAQQHGNEHSGKEGALILASILVKPEYSYLFDKIDFMLIPQMNPDGSEADKRFNANKMDLNRNHLILSESETIALHKLFNRYRFEVTMDVHEYYPFTETWKEFGYYKSADEQFGLTSNLNVSEKIRKFSKENVFPFLKDFVNDQGFTMNEYLVGGPPNVERLRHSTVDINDGRQSLGIQNTLSFILEGKNGKDSSAHNIWRRAEGQFTTMLGLLDYVYKNADKIKSLVHGEREKLLQLGQAPVVIRMEHTGIGGTITVPAADVNSGKDTTITLEKYHPVVNNLMEVVPPQGYLINSTDTLLMNFISNHSINYKIPEFPEDTPVEQILIKTVDSMDLEEMRLADVKFTTEQKFIKDITGEYIYVPVSQIKRNTIVTAFEPQAMLGLVQYERFVYLTKTENYPILRIPWRN